MRILRLWGFPDGTSYERIATRETEVYLVDNRWYLKRWDDIDAVQDLHMLCAHLHARGVPVAVPLLAADGQPYAYDGDAAYFLRPRLEGDTLDDFDAIDWYTMAYIVGAETAKLHRAMADCPALRKILDADAVHALDMEDMPVIREHRLLERIGFAEEDISPYLQSFRALYPYLPRQITHHDLHGNNLLFRDGELCGVIDMDTCAYDARLFDPVYFTGWLLWRMGENHRRWEEFMTRTLQGYASVLALTPQEREATPGMLLANQLHAVAVWLREGEEDRTRRSMAALRHAILTVRSGER